MPGGRDARAQLGSRAGFGLVTPLPACRAGLPDRQTHYIKGTGKVNFKDLIWSFTIRKTRNVTGRKFSKIIYGLVLLLFYITYEGDVHIVFSVLSGL